MAVMYQCVWIVPMPGVPVVQCQSVGTSVGSAQSFPAAASQARPPGRLSSVSYVVAFTKSIADVAAVTAAVPWLATVLELAATSNRLVTAISPKTSTTMATSASTSVKPAWAPRPER